MSRLVMVNELAPIIEKVLVMEPLIESIAVVMPTNAISPMAIITMVKTVRNAFVFIESQEIRRFSWTNAPVRILCRFIGGISS
jgi:hypothetical protein